MSLWELREAFERAVPWWAPFALAIAIVVAALLADERAARRRRK